MNPAIGDIVLEMCRSRYCGLESEMSFDEIVGANAIGNLMLMADGASSSLFISSTVYAATVTGICVGWLTGLMATIGDASNGGKKYFDGMSTCGVAVGVANVVDDTYASFVLLMIGVAVGVDGVAYNEYGRYVVTGGAIVDGGGIYWFCAYRLSIGSEL